MCSLVDCLQGLVVPGEHFHPAVYNFSCEKLSPESLTSGRHSCGNDNTMMHRRVHSHTSPLLVTIMTQHKCEHCHSTSPLHKCKCTARAPILFALALPPFKASCSNLTTILLSANMNMNTPCMHVSVVSFQPLAVWHSSPPVCLHTWATVVTSLTYHLTLSLHAHAQHRLTHLAVFAPPHPSLCLSSYVSDCDHLAHPSPHPVLHMSAQCHLPNLNLDLTLPHHPCFTLTQHAASSSLAGAITLGLGLVCKHKDKCTLHSCSCLHASIVLCRYPGDDPHLGNTAPHAPMVCLLSTSSASLFFGPSIPQTMTATCSYTPSGTIAFPLSSWYFQLISAHLCTVFERWRAVLISSPWWQLVYMLGSLLIQLHWQHPKKGCHASCDMGGPRSGDIMAMWLANN